MDKNTIYITISTNWKVVCNIYFINVGIDLMLLGPTDYIFNSQKYKHFTPQDTQVCFQVLGQKTPAIYSKDFKIIGHIFGIISSV